MMGPMWAIAVLVCFGEFVVGTRPTRKDVLETAQRRIQQSHSPKRVPTRAGTTSTFGRFLAGHEDPYVRSAQLSAQKEKSPSIAVVDYGADPTCSRSSSDAFDAAVTEALKHHTGRYMANNIKDLGGVTVDLQGGDYLLSRPISIPEGVGNLHIKSGTLRAALSFPKEQYLLEVGGDIKACASRDKQGSCNQNVGIEDIMFDGNWVAHGGLRINATMGANVGPDMFFIHHTHAGFTANGGHEAMLHQAWFGTTYYDDNQTTNATFQANSVDIELNGYDYVVSDVVCFSGAIGLLSTGSANVIEGVHTWNMGSWLGGQGIVIAPEFRNAGVVRLSTCYLDYNDLVLQDPTFVSVTSTFFLGAGKMVLKAKSGVINGLSLIANEWHNVNMKPNETVVLDERSHKFTSVSDLVMMGNFADLDKFTVRAVTVTKALSQKAAKKWTFDFSDSFIFPDIPIKSVTYSVSGSGFTRHMARPAVGHLVTVETEDAIDATVTVTASQADFTVGNGPKIADTEQLVLV